MKNELVPIKCKDCMHAGICKHMHDYMGIRDTLMKLMIFSEGRSKNIEDYSFISDISIGCMFYHGLTTINLRCNSTNSEDSTGYTEIKHAPT